MTIRESHILIDAINKSYKEKRRDGQTQVEIARDLNLSRKLIWQLRKEGLIEEPEEKNVIN